MRLSLIWAMTRNRVIGADDGLPWRLPDEMRHFRRTTLGKPVIMGRKTFDTSGVLAHRFNIVLTRSRDWSADGAVVVHDLETAVERAREFCQLEGCEEAVVIGGAEIYALALPLADRLYETVIDAELDGDTFFPPYDESEWRELDVVRHEVDERHPYAYTTRILERL